MFQFSIEFDQAKFLETLKIVGAEETYGALLVRFAQEIETSVKANTPWKTGALRREWFHTPGLQTMTLQRSLTNKLPYAIFVEEGTRPHEIRPRNKKALAWQISAGQAALGGPVSNRIRTTNKLTGKPLKSAKMESFIVVRSVHHPGTKPVKMLENTLVTLQPFFEDEFGRTIDQIWSSNA